MIKTRHIICGIAFSIGIFGNLAALYILYKWIRARNRKHILMLNFLAINDLVSVLGMFIMIILDQNEILDRHTICKGYVMMRAFGLSSGSIALIMAIERWIALTKPFLYQQLITYQSLFRCLVFTWIISTIWTQLPLFGFGLYYKDGECLRYRDATEFHDRIYAFLYFVVGTTMLLTISILDMLLVWTLSRINSNRKILIRRISKSTMGDNMITQKRTPEEIAFSKLMCILCISFVVCWAPQMICVPLIQFYGKKKWVVFLSHMADMLMAIYFTLDPYIYVLFRYIEKDKFFLYKTKLKMKHHPNNIKNDTSSSTLTDMSVTHYTSAI